MYSMRSHKTGEYQLMYDSNTNIMLHKLAGYTASDTVTITIPRNSDLDQLIQFRNLSNLNKCVVIFKFLNYGIHAGDTRDTMDFILESEDIDWSSYDFVECHIESVRPRLGQMRWEYMIFNSSVLHEERPYADKHFTNILRLLDKGYHMKFSTRCQLSMIPDQLLTSASIDVDFFSPEVADYITSKYIDLELLERLKQVVPTRAKFFPFRLSDKAYCFDKVYPDYKVVVTDPNESCIEHENIINISSMHLCKKTLYTTMLLLMRDRPDVRIPLYEDITFNYHISIVEMLYYIPSSIDFMYPVPSKILEILKDKYIKS